MSTQEGLIVHSNVGVRAHTLRARRREAVVVRVDNRIIKRGEDGEELGLNGGIRAATLEAAAIGAG